MARSEELEQLVREADTLVEDDDQPSDYPFTPDDWEHLDWQIHYQLHYGQS